MPCITVFEKLNILRLPNNYLKVQKIAFLQLKKRVKINLSKIGQIEH